MQNSTGQWSALEDKSASKTSKTQARRSLSSESPRARVGKGRSRGSDLSYLATRTARGGAREVTWVTSALDTSERQSGRPGK